ncbi:N,N-dimethylformamidase beta subunit family domain-containing protein [Massilia glaciei]|uniref:N,N-dimethylformamidase beta subunit family domain-containing protein n=1 Tax=Massilia glaciei TaxID=1524097 RepID=UPI0015E828B2|nr:N,N-dimethylformamidase beta subunit family domain-containing protein [Massilia glaciei]
MSDPGHPTEVFFEGKAPIAPGMLCSQHFALADAATVAQVTLRFQCYGMHALAVLKFTFHDAHGQRTHEINSGPARPLAATGLNRLRRHILFLRLESALRSLLNMPRWFIVELPCATLRSGGLRVDVVNTGKFPVLVSGFALHTSPLDPARRVRNDHPLEGYAGSISVTAGEPLALFVHSPQALFAVEVIRFGASAATRLRIDDVPGRAQDYAQNAYEQGADWDRTTVLQTDPGWRAGLYVARLSDCSGALFDITFVVKRKVGEAAAALAVLASTNTWQAYNAWAGASIYEYHIDDGLHRPDIFVVHQLRPNPAATMIDARGHLACEEKHVLAWLEREGIDYDLYSDSDLDADPGLLARHRALVLNTHSEYWTGPMYDGLERFLDGGGNLAYLSANGLFWKTAARGHQLEVRHDCGRHSFIDEAGGRWRDHGRPETRAVGIRFTRAGQKSGFKPYRVLSPGHWIFAGTGVKKGSLIGERGTKYQGASGWELDTIDARARPAGLVHLAKGCNAWGSGADMTYFTHAGGGGVFAVGSITFGGSLVVDAVLSRMMRNVFARFLRGAGAAPAAKAGLAADAGAVEA